MVGMVGLETESPFGNVMRISCHQVLVISHLEANKLHHIASYWSYWSYLGHILVISWSYLGHIDHIRWVIWVKLQVGTRSELVLVFRWSVGPSGGNTRQKAALF